MEQLSPSSVSTLSAMANVYGPMAFHSVNSPICVLQPKTASFNSVDFICAKNWLLSAYCQNFLSTEQILFSLQWHVYQNESNVDQNESYLVEVRMLNFIFKVSMRNSSSTTRTINKHGRFVSF